MIEFSLNRRYDLRFHNPPAERESASPSWRHHVEQVQLPVVTVGYEVVEKLLRRGVEQLRSNASLVEMRDVGPVNSLDQVQIADEGIDRLALK